MRAFVFLLLLMTGATAQSAQPANQTFFEGVHSSRWRTPYVVVEERMSIGMLTGETAAIPFGSAHNCAYPPIAIRLNQSGQTSLQFAVTAQGKAENIVLSSSSGHNALDEAAVRCVSEWSYKSATRDGLPFSVPWQVNIKWGLEGLDNGFYRYAFESWRCVLSQPLSAGDRQLQPTELLVWVKDHKIETVSVFNSSGNTELDARAVACFSHASPEAARLLNDQTQLIPVFWDDL